MTSLTSGWTKNAYYDLPDCQVYMDDTEGLDTRQKKGAYVYRATSKEVGSICIRNNTTNNVWMHLVNEGFLKISGGSVYLQVIF